VNVDLAGEKAAAVEMRVDNRVIFIVKYLLIEKGFAPEAEFLEKIKAIPGISVVETQTITNMEI